MAQQIDRVQRVLKDVEGTAVSRIVVRQGVKDLDEEGGEAAAGGKEPHRAEEEAAPVVKENWVKVAAMATGRFVPQKPEEKKPVTKNTPHGYFRAPA
ncbi:hypothetical protein VOLCADRAFT_117021 [Volvox carteri f. nagariensis]|uniref:Uncharacterized protein n=1 Tax=Volvox carteri f. nagariensis TaxID=3068 RepID=D8TRK8_VOLCA|nr:uncharacterized protein VOLCADRAFT_117021 [Volvox carteri f. nagariensis]EFJ49910.1 hypothetical protein VOLCADRAFT_117021 [Volvox carteri f. nagariensis]|eukprot:XP_002948975.1 hypothetical protein VOLCADRAFT_117021 [Volvox carteri f. nagariensis]